MILAAGFGTRLQPYSTLRPKPLFPVLDRPLVLRIIDQLHAAGFSPVLVNCHHLKEQIVSLLGNRDDVVLQEEQIELGTGGGMRMALDFFGNEPVLVANGDIFHTIDLKAAYDAHCKSGAAATLVVHDYPRFNNVCMDADGCISSFGEADSSLKKMAFTGIHVLNPELLSVIPEATFYNIIDCYRYWIEKGEKISAHAVENHFWADMGTPLDYLQLHRVLLTEKPFQGDSPFFIGKNVVLPHDFSCEGWFCIGSDVSVGRRCHLNRVVVWDGVRIPDDSNISDMIIV